MAPRDGSGVRGMGEMGGMVDGTPVGPPDIQAMAITDGTGAMTSDAGDASDVGPCERHRGGGHGGCGQAQ